MKRPYSVVVEYPGAEYPAYDVKLERAVRRLSDHSGMMMRGKHRGERDLVWDFTTLRAAVASFKRIESLNLPLDTLTIRKYIPFTKE